MPSMDRKWAAFDENWLETRFHDETHFFLVNFIKVHLIFFYLKYYIYRQWVHLKVKINSQNAGKCLAWTGYQLHLIQFG